MESETEKCLGHVDVDARMQHLIEEECEKVNCVHGSHLEEQDRGAKQEPPDTIGDDEVECPLDNGHGGFYSSFPDGMF